MSIITRRNLIDAESESFETGMGFWTDDVADFGGTAPVLTRETDVFLTSPAALSIQGTSDADAFVQLLSTDGATRIAVEPEIRYRFSVHLRPADINTPRTITVSLTYFTVGGIQTGSVTSSDLVEYHDDFRLMTVIARAPSDAHDVRIVVEVQGMLTDEIHYLDGAALVDWDGWTKNITLRHIQDWIPAYMKKADLLQTGPDSPMNRFMDIASLLEEDVLTQFKNFFFRPVAEGGFSGQTSSLVDPEVAETEWLTWLAQLVGVTPSFFLISGFTSWTSLELAAPTWADWESTFAHWSDIEGFNPIPFDVMAILRDSILHAENGFRAGTLAAMRVAVQRVLTDTKSVSFTQHVGGDMWALQINVIPSEDPGGTTVIDAANTTKPAGLVLSVGTFAGGGSIADETNVGLLLEDDDFLLLEG